MSERSSVADDTKRNAGSQPASIDWSDIYSPPLRTLSQGDLPAKSTNGNDANQPEFLDWNSLHPPDEKQVLDKSSASDSIDLSQSSGTLSKSGDGRLSYSSTTQSDRSSLTGARDHAFNTDINQVQSPSDTTDGAKSFDFHSKPRSLELASVPIAPLTPAHNVEGESKIETKPESAAAKTSDDRLGFNMGGDLMVLGNVYNSARPFATPGRGSIVLGSLALSGYGLYNWSSGKSPITTGDAVIMGGTGAYALSQLASMVPRIGVPLRIGLKIAGASVAGGGLIYRGLELKDHFQP